MKVTKLKTFLGLVNYNAKFLPDLATRLAPLYKLLQHGEPWSWSTQQEAAFRDVKNLLLTPQVLAHFDDSKPIVLSCDASPFGVGAVLSQILDDGSEHPVAFVSCSLSKAELNYAHIDKEALAIVFGIGKFHQYWQVPSVHQWQMFYSFHRSQAPYSHFQRIQICSSNGFSSIAEMGPDT